MKRLVPDGPVSKPYIAIKLHTGESSYEKSSLPYPVMEIKKWKNSQKGQRSRYRFKEAS
jgi:rRNA processing protein Gar1